MVRLRYLGLSFFEIVTDEGKVVYVDPCMSPDINPGCPITLDEVERADLVLVSHRARDHSSDLIPLATKTGALVVCTRDVHFSMKRSGIPESQIRIVASGVWVEAAGMRVKSLRTEHGSFSVEDEWPTFDLSVGYILYVRDGLGIYHMGDTSLFGDLQLFGRWYRPKVMLVPVGARAGGITCMDPWEAAIAVGMVGPEIAIPMHYDPIGQADNPTRFARHLATEAPQTEARLLRAGDVLKL